MTLVQLQDYLQATQSCDPEKRKDTPETETETFELDMYEFHIRFDIIISDTLFKRSFGDISTVIEFLPG